MANKSAIKHIPFLDPHLVAHSLGDAAPLCCSQPVARNAYHEISILVPRRIHGHEAHQVKQLDNWDPKNTENNTRNTPFPAPEMVPFTFRKGPTTGVTLSPSSPWCPLKSVLCGSLLKLAHAFAWHVLLGYLKLPFFFPICYVQFISRNDEPIGILVGLFLCYVFLLLPCRVTDNQFRFDHAYPCFSGKKRLFQSLRPKNMYYVSLPLDYFGLRPCGHLSRRSGSGKSFKNCPRLFWIQVGERLMVYPD